MSVATVRPVLDFRGRARPECPERVVFELPVSAEEATRAVAKWLIWHVGTAVIARAPRLQIIGEDRGWVVPLHVSLPDCEPVGPFHWIQVDAVTGELLIPADEVEAIRSKSTPILHEIDSSLREWWQEVEQRRAHLDAKHECSPQ